MAQELADGEFWLPPEFLNDEDFIPTKLNSPAPVADLNKASSGLYGFGLYGHSDKSSPVESVLGSTETESDEEDFNLNGLTQKLNNTSLKEDLWKLDTNFNGFISEINHSKSKMVMATSPQSTLCGCKHGSSRTSPNCTSPPVMAAEAEVKQNQPSLDLLYAAAGEVARMRMIEEAASRYYNPSKSYLPQQHARKPTNPNLHYQQLQLAQFQKLKQQQIAKQQYLQMLLQNRARNEVQNFRPVSPALSGWPTPQQAHNQPSQRPIGSGMRAVFLGNPNTKRESTGTGVFLPRQPGAPTEPVKKRGCSTVLLPDRVVRALDLKLETIGDESKLQSRCNGGSFGSEAEIMYRKSVALAQQRRNNNRQQANAMTEFRLPQEWTY